MTPPRKRTSSSTSSKKPLSRSELAGLDAWFRAANYLAVGQIYLLDNPLLKRDLVADDIKPRLLGHWGTTPGLNLVYAHLNRLIRQRDVNAIFLAGPGHGGPAAVANAYLEGTYSEVYPRISEDAEGLQALFRQFSFPGGIPSHVAPETPGSIHEGGELGYVLSHAYGAAMDNPDLVVAAVVGDGEFETGPLATSWHANKFIDPTVDGAVLPILHLNGYKIANPTVPARIPREELTKLLEGYGHEVITVEGDDPADVHQQMAAALDRAHDSITAIQDAARSGKKRRGSADADRPRWPMILLVTPKGWTGPKTVDGVQVEGTWRAHQVPLAETRTNEDHRVQLQRWMESYDPAALFGEDGRLVADVKALAPAGDRRMSANPHANGGLLRKPLRIRDFREYAIEVKTPGGSVNEATRVFGSMVADIVRDNPTSFRLFGPDETESNRLGAVYEATDKVFAGKILPVDEHLERHGRVMEMLSEHTCQGWLEGYLLTGRHGLFSCYEAFIHIVDSMFNQHAKWLNTTRELEWRPPLASLNYLLTSHVWRQDHNGFTHQDPGFIDIVLNKKPEIVRAYFPPDTNTLLSTMAHCLQSEHYVNVVVAGKQPQFDWLDADQAADHCARGVGIWEWASNDDGDPDVVIASAGDIPTLEALAAVSLLRKHLPDLKIRYINVVDLMRLQDEKEHPHGLAGRDFDTLFTRDKPIIFAYHGYPWVIHRLTYRRTNHDNLHVRGYKEEGTTTTPFDMVMMNDLDRYHLVIDVIDRVPSLGSRAAQLRQDMMDARRRAKEWTRTYGEDAPEVSGWTWDGSADGEGSPSATSTSETSADFG
ncbi:phosphoketolase family protein [Luteipulveratus flavus]|uniref:Probable phosphoketolase n=1 Tax=Luteipulveratus flavus TaxID=3031728 RepID=A0ABT6C1M3_9MICO|nr:phosphoketolase family protein [Luteipulveratus sp. YIM 133296]MDF8262788.1 phosphoketolase family protein [Luteipulveratus sp. YIM 133296]